MNKLIIWHPLLAWIYPIIFLYSFNLGQTSINNCLLMLMISIITALGLLLLYNKWLKNQSKAITATTTTALLFFSYGHVQSIIHAPHWLLFVIWLILLIKSLLWINNSSHSWVKLHKIIFVFLVTILTPLLVRIVNYESSNLNWQYNQNQVKINPQFKPNLDYQPDIYYLIFDRYASRETYKNVYNHDNQDFYDNLLKQGFSLVDPAFSNYHKTTFSIASSLNLTYLDFLPDFVSGKSDDLLPLEKMLATNTVVTFLKEQGYTYYHLGSGWDPTSWNPHADKNINISLPNEFALLVYRSSMLSALQSIGLWKLEEDQQQRLNLQFSKILEIPSDTRTTFTFGHFLLPHPPFIFDETGNLLPTTSSNNQQQKERYIQQVKFTNSQIEKIVEVILAKSSRPPIIIIQSDEGPYPDRYNQNQKNFDWEQASDDELRQKSGILLTYYFPSLDNTVKITSPVNIFRVVFSKYFGADLEILPSKFFVSNDLTPYKFVEVSSQLINN